MKGRFRALPRLAKEASMRAFSLPASLLLSGVAACCLPAAEVAPKSEAPLQAATTPAALDAAGSGAVAESGGTSGTIVFAAGFGTGGTCHRDAPMGCDLYVGRIDLDTGVVSGIRLLAGQSGAQWFPAISPDGTKCAFNESFGPHENRIREVALAGGAVRTLAEEARFPAYAPDGRSLYYSTGREGSVERLDLATLRATGIPIGSAGEDVTPVGSRFLAMHTRGGNGGRAEPLLYDLQTGRLSAAECPGCGHLTASPTGDAVLASSSGSGHLLVAHVDAANGSWSSFAPLPGDFRGELAALGPKFGPDATILMAYTAWPLRDRIVVSAMAGERAASSGKLVVDASRLVLLKTEAGQTHAVPLVFDGQPTGDAVSAAIYPDAGSASNASATGATGLEQVGSGTALLPAGAKAAGDGGPLLYLTILMRNKDPDFPGSADYVTDRDAYLADRQALRDLALLLERKGLTWSWESDWNFLEGVIANDIQKPDPEAMASTEGKNIVAFVAAHGAGVEPHSHETHGYDYADVANLFRRLGVEPDPVVGGHIYDPADAHFQHWPDMARGLHGQKYPDDPVWKPTILVGAATFKHKGEREVTGVWRPKSADAYFEHDPKGPMVAIGAWNASEPARQRLFEDLSNGTLPGGHMYTAAYKVNNFTLGESGYLSMFEKNLGTWLDRAARGEVAFVRHSQIPAIWKERFGEEGYNYSVDAPAHGQGGRGGPGGRGEE
jgi:hypothetical protein